MGYRSRKDAKQYAVLGLGKFGMSVARELSAAGDDVLAVDNDEERAAEAKDFCTYAVKADVCDVGTLMSLGISNMDGVVVAITGNYNASIIATITAKELGVPYVMSKASDPVHAKILEKIGADRVIIPEKESGVRVARALSSGRFLDFIELSDRIRLIELNPRTDWVGRTLRELDLRRQESINVVALRMENGELTVSPDPDMPLTQKCAMIITVDREDIHKLVGE